MPNDIFQALVMMLASPWYRWEKACDMKRSYLPWKITRFKHYVDVTKMAIRRTLSYKHYPEPYIPRIDVVKIKDKWSLDITLWGHPDHQKYE